MEYILENITFNKNTKYNQELYWDLYNIYTTYTNPTNDINYASAVASKYGVLLLKEVIDNIDDSLYDFLYYRDLLLLKVKYNIINTSINHINNITNLEEIKALYNDTNKNINKSLQEQNSYIENQYNQNIDKYYNRITKSIPQNILNKVKDIRLFKIGYIEKDIYNMLINFKNDLKNWLQHPTNSNLEINIEDNYNDKIEFHDNHYKIEVINNDILFKGDNTIKFIKGIINIDDKELEEIEFDGYNMVGSITYNNKVEICFEVYIKYKNKTNKTYQTIIVIADDIIVN
ncbi:MAG: hypothetical protein VZS44_03685 [Bacilli bacterium]|nr:hypothetical protein [Bacilli bacterium]